MNEYSGTLWAADIMENLGRLLCLDNNSMIGGVNMKISTKGRYALRMMVDLALHHTGEMIRVKEVAARQGISEKYMEQIIAMLKRAGYVKSLRGASGGYKLAKDPVDYTVGMVLRLTEGNMAPISCLEDEENACDMAESCVSLPLWKMLDDAIKGVIDHVTLQDMVDWELKRQKKEQNS